MNMLFRVISSVKGNCIRGDNIHPLIKDKDRRNDIQYINARLSMNQQFFVRNRRGLDRQQLEVPKIFGKESVWLAGVQRKDTQLRYSDCVPHYCVGNIAERYYY
jgi:hypothetical protein